MNQDILIHVANKDIVQIAHEMAKLKTQLAEKDKEIGDLKERVQSESAFHKEAAIMCLEKDQRIHALEGELLKFYSKLMQANNGHELAVIALINRDFPLAAELTKKDNP
jgi:predicted  nucleic acid-binding Zn-ribbon protein